jgi:hypothetical protein
MPMCLRLSLSLQNARVTASSLLPETMLGPSLHRLLLDERLWTSPTLKFIMINDILFSGFLTVFMLYRFLKIAVSIDRQYLAKYGDSRQTKAWFPLWGRQYFFGFLRYKTQRLSWSLWV